MKTQLALLLLLTTLCGCEDANEVTGPALPVAVKKTQPPTTARPESRAQPLVVPNPRGAAVAPTRPYVTPTPRAYPCMVDPGDIEKNEPCRPCDDITVAPDLQPKNKPCHVYSPTPTPLPTRRPRIS